MINFKLCSSFIIICFFFIKVFAQEPQINIVYPRNNQRVQAHSKTYIIGNVSPADSTLTINGNRVPIYKTGAFLAFLPIKKGRFSFNCNLVTKDGASIDKKLFIKIPFAKGKKTTDQPLIEKDNFLPNQNIGALIGEEITFQCKTLPEKKVVVKIDQLQNSFPMQESTQNGIKGIYRTSHSFYTPIKESSLSFQVQNSPDIPNFTPAVKISILPPSEFPVLQIIKHNTKARFKPGKGYDTFLRKGTKLKSTGYKGNWQKAKLSNHKTVYLPENQVKILPPSAIISQATVGNIYAYEDDSQVTIKLFKTSQVNGSWMEYPDEKKISLKLYKTVPNIDRISIDPDSKTIKHIKWQQIDDDILQIDFYLSFTPVHGYYLNFKKNTGIVTIKKPIYNRSLKNIKICIDAGHGGIDSGAIGPLETKESEVNLLQALDLQKHLIKQGFDIIMTRKDDKGPSLYERAPFAHHQNADIFISIHHNSVGDGVNPYKSRSTETFFYNEGGKILGSFIHPEILKVTMIKDAGLKYGNLSVCRNNAVPSVLLEIDYLIIPEAEERILNDKFREQISSAITNAILKYIKTNSTSSLKKSRQN